MSRHSISFCLSSQLARHEQSVFVKMLTYPIKCIAAIMKVDSFWMCSAFLLVTCPCRHSGLSALLVVDICTDCKCLEYLLNDFQGSPPPWSRTVPPQLQTDCLASSFAKKDLGGCGRQQVAHEPAICLERRPTFY